MLRLFSYLFACSLLTSLTATVAAATTHQQASGSNNQVGWVAVSTHSDADFDKAYEKAPSAENGDLFMTKFDALTSDELCGKLRKLHSSFLASGRKTPPPEKLRPVYAPTEVVNCAFREWIGDPNYVACQQNIHEAIFATPAQCMRSPTAVLDNPLMINFERQNKLNKRSKEQCVYTVVKCLSERFFTETEDDLVAKLQKQGWDQPYFAPEKLFARKEVVEKAWKKWNSVRLGGVEGIKSDTGCICGKPSNEVGVQEGSYFAVFAQDGDCAQGKPPKQKAPTSPYGGGYGGGGGACRTINVECV